MVSSGSYLRSLPGGGCAYLHVGQAPVKPTPPVYGGDDVAGVERGEGGDVGDDFGDGEDHVAEMGGLDQSAR